MDVPEIAILQANLGNFDTPVDPVEQSIPSYFHRWTDDNFLPIADLPGRFQYRIPKLFGWQMLPNYKYYIWLDGGWTFSRPDCATWYLDQLGEAEVAFFEHPTRHSAREEVEHIDDYVNRRKGTKRGQDYLISRYNNGLHNEMLAEIEADVYYKDNRLYASTTFIYRNTPRVQHFMKEWWFYQSRYYTCDQICLPWLLWRFSIKTATLRAPIYKNKYLTEASKHK
jgi:hypothetical protein